MGDGAAHGVRLRYAVETEPLGTAGGVRNAVDLVRGLVVVLNGDILTDLDLSAMLALPRGARLARDDLPHPRRRSLRQYGLVELEADGPHPELRREATRRADDDGHHQRRRLRARPRGARPRSPPAARCPSSASLPGLLADRVPFFGWVAEQLLARHRQPGQVPAGPARPAGRARHARRSRPPGGAGRRRASIAPGARARPGRAVTGPLRDRRRQPRRGAARGWAPTAVLGAGCVVGADAAVSRAPSSGTASRSARARCCATASSARAPGSAPTPSSASPRSGADRADPHVAGGPRAAAEGPAARATACYPEPDGHRADPQLLHRRPHRPRQVHPGRPAPVPHRDHGRQEGGGPGAGLDGPGEGARHHHQGPHGPPALSRARRARSTRSTSSTRRATWTSPTRSRARSPPARARS